MSESNDHKCSNLNLNHAAERSFWDCTKPCGLLTTALGVVLLVTSALSALFLLETSLCTALGTCSNALVTLYAFSALVCGIVLVFIGLVIVVYTKKDVRVIVTTAKNFDKFVHYKEPNMSNASPAKNTPTNNKQMYRKNNHQLSVDHQIDTANLPLLNRSETAPKIVA